VATVIGPLLIAAEVFKVTCWLKRDFVLNGAPHEVSVPTTLVLRRSGGDRKVALIHSTRVAT
jgi:hypothetical protein